MSNLTILDGIRVASPCPANWDEMVGDDRTRFCSGCKKDVYNISGLTTEEALGLVSTGGEAPCVRFYRRGDGTVLTSDCPVGSRKLRRRLVRRVAGVGVVGLAMVASGLTALGFSRRNSIPPMPTWAGATFSDWVDWGMISIGLRQPRAMTMGAICMPPMMPSTTSGTPVAPVMGEMDAVLPNPTPEPPPGMTLGKMVAPIQGGADIVPPPAPIQP